MSWNQDTHTTDHAALMAEAATADIDKCLYNLSDLADVVEDTPDDNPKLGHYLDSMHYYSMRVDEIKSNTVNLVLQQYRK